MTTTSVASYPSLASRRARHTRHALVTWLAWIVCALAIMFVVWRRSSRPGTPSDPPAYWPGGAAILRDPTRGTVVLFAHPQCPCTRASVSQLGQALEAIGDRVSAHIVFVIPDGEPDGWMETATWERARVLPGVQIHVDRGGHLARRFNAAVSGQTVLYDAAGRLAFSGGITLSRGHEGDNPGRSRLVGIALRGTASRRDSPVFGCALFDSNDDDTTVTEGTP